MPFIASMGIYVISKDVMLDLLRNKFPAANDFGSEVIPGATSLGLRVCPSLIFEEFPLKYPCYYLYFCYNTATQSTICNLYWTLHGEVFWSINSPTPIALECIQAAMIICYPAPQRKILFLLNIF